MNRIKASPTTFLRGWLLWTAGFLALPLAGFAGSAAIGRVDGPLAALAGGAIAGLITAPARHSQAAAGCRPAGGSQQQLSA